ncbi:hypothetical protein K9L67_05810, partial [Candidatus Woesearchaeota archaeon]|nr:hypothetical protein [Candidatus Woesearchaeota archaeon]
MNDIVIGRSNKDREKYGEKGAIFLGKHYIKMGRTNSLSNNIYLDMINSHVVFICGKRGGGKCLTGDTRITLGDGSLVSIADLENDDREILSLNENLKVKSTLKDEFFKRSVNKTLLITLKTGKQIRLTPEHPLLTVKGWNSVENLKIGSRIAVPRIQRVFGEDDLSEDKVKILAYLITEGHINNNFILFTNKDEKLISDYCNSINQFDSNLKIMDHGDFSVRVVENKVRKVISPKRDKKGKFSKGIIFDSKSSLRNWLDSIKYYGLNSKDKYIPQEIFKLPKHKLSLFLNRLFSCDGSIYSESNRWRISYSSISRRLIDDVQHLLSRFEIVSKIRTKSTKSDFGVAYELIIQSSFLRMFIEEIGFFGDKQEKQKIAFLETEKIKSNPNLDTVPKEIWDIYRPSNWVSVGKSLGYSSPKAARSSINYSCSRQKLAQIALTDNNEFALDLANSDIYWDELISIKEINEKVDVYDFSVPNTHNFVANDIIVHNSYTMGVIAEGVADLPEDIKKNISIILVDTMGVYWTMKYGNKQDRDVLEEWNLDAKDLDVKIFTPSKYHEEYKDKGIPTDFPFSIKPSELSGHDWNVTFNVSDDDSVGVLIERLIYELKESGKEYGIKEILEAIESDKDSDINTKNAVKNRFLNAQNWGLFSKRATKISDIAMPGQVSVLDVSCYATMQGSWNIKNLVVGLVAEKLFIQRMTSRKEEEYNEVHKSLNPYSDVVKKQEFPLVWLVVDEAHEFLPVKGKTLATEPLVTILREGRQPGISLILATQQPGKIHTDV